MPGVSEVLGDHSESSRDTIARDDYDGDGKEQGSRVYAFNPRRYICIRDVIPIGFVDSRHYGSPWTRLQGCREAGKVYKGGDPDREPSEKMTAEEAKQRR